MLTFSQTLPTDQRWTVALRLNELSPESWCAIELREIARVQNGFAFPSAKFNKRGDGMPIIRIRDVGKAEAEACYSGEYDSSYVVKRGDILVGMDGEFRCRKWAGQDGLLNQRVCRVALKTQFYDSEFLFVMLQPYLSAVEQVTSSVTVRHLSSRTIERLPVVIPPLNEQRRIVAKLDALQERREAAKEALDAIPPLLERFRQSVLAAAFRGDLTREWREQNPDVEPASVLLERIREERKRLFIEETADKARAKAEAKAEKTGKAWGGEQDAIVLERERAKAEKKYVEPGLPDDVASWGTPRGWLSISAEWLFYWGSGRNLPVKRMAGGEVPVIGGNGVSGHHDAPNCLHATVVVGRVGANCGNVHLSSAPAWITDNAIFATAVSSLVDLRYAAHFMGHLELRQRARGGGQPFVSQETLNEVTFLLPPMEEQLELVRAMEDALTRHRSLGRYVEAASRRLEELNRSILEQAFRGHLVPQDPNDEPATVLLDRIRSEQAANEPKKKRTRKRTTGS